MQRTDSLETLLRLIEIHMEDGNVPVKFMATVIEEVRKEYPKC